MRIRLLLALLVGASPALAQLPATPVEGTWEMVSQVIVYPDSVVDRGATLSRAFKILNSTHFAFGRQVVVNGVNQDEVYGGGGRYELIGDTVYVEHIDFHSSPDLVGHSIRFSAMIDGDTWYHEGRIGDSVLREVWRRVR
jgi:hypothetical protein